MEWSVVLRPEVAEDIHKAASWYDSRSSGLGDKFVEAVLLALDELSINPLLNSRRQGASHVRWRYPQRFPYRIIYQVNEAEKLVVVAAVLHAARSDPHWQRRIR